MNYKEKFDLYHVNTLTKLDVYEMKQTKNMCKIFMFNNIILHFDFIYDLIEWDFYLPLYVCKNNIDYILSNFNKTYCNDIAIYKNCLTQTNIDIYEKNYLIQSNTKTGIDNYYDIKDLHEKLDRAYINY